MGCERLAQRLSACVQKVLGYREMQRGEAAAACVCRGWGKAAGMGVRRGCACSPRGWEGSERGWGRPAAAGFHVPPTHSAGAFHRNFPNVFWGKVQPTGPGLSWAGAQHPPLGGLQPVRAHGVLPAPPWQRSHRPAIHGRIS